MKLKKLIIFWFWNYKKEVEIDFSRLDDSKSYCLVTWENWVWKSMLFELIVNCLTWTWRVSNLKDLANKEIIEQWKDCFVKLHLDDEKWSEYVIEKIIEANKLSLYIEFYRITQNWDRIDIASWNKESKKAIEEFIQIDSNSVYDSIYSCQWELLSFFNRSPDEARRIIMNLLWTEWYLDKSKNAFSIWRNIWSRIKEIEESFMNSWIQEWTKEEIENEIDSKTKELDQLKKVLLKFDQLKDIKENEFNFDFFEDISKKINEIDNQDLLNDEIEKNENKLESSREILNNNEKKILELKNIETNLNKSKEKLNNYEIELNEKESEIKEIEKSLKNEKIEELKNEKEFLINEKNKLEVELNEFKKKEKELLNNWLQIFSWDEMDFHSERFWEFNEELLDELNSDKKKIEEEIISLRLEHSKKREIFLENQEKIKNWNIALCECCWTLIEKDKYEEYHKNIKKFNIDISDNYESIKKLKELNKELLKEIQDIEKDWKWKKEEIEFIENFVNSINFINIQKDQSKIKAKLNLWRYDENISSINLKIENIQKLGSLKENYRKLKEVYEEQLNELNLLSESFKKLWDKNIIEKEIKIKNKEIEELIERIKTLRDNEKLLNEFKIQELNFLRFKEKIENFLDRKLKKTEENNLKDFYEKNIKNQEIDNSKEKLNLLENDIKELHKKISLIEKQENEKKKLEYLEREKMYFDWLWEIYDFIAKDLYKKSLPIIKSIVNDKLSISSKWKYQFYIETEKDWKEVFIPKIHLVWESYQKSRSVSTLSWWEATWVATALREAFTLLASKRSWFQWSFWIFDETFWNQDWDHLNSLIDALMKNSFLKQVFLITHDSEAKEKIRELWGQEIELYRDKDWATQIKFNSY